MIITQCSPQEAENFINKNDMQQFMNCGDLWEAPTNSIYLVLSPDEDTKPVALCKYEQFTNTAINYHVYLLPEYWGLATSDCIQLYLEEWFLQNTPYKVLVTFIPEVCKEVCKAATRVGFLFAGLLPEISEWQNQKTGLVILMKKIGE